MTEPSLPRWQITFRRADEDQDQTLIIAADSMVTAIKQAQMDLYQRGNPFRITLVEPAPEEAASC